MLLFIASGELFMLSAENTKGASATVATTATAFLETDNSTERDISFGDGSSFATGVSEWKSVKHNAAILGPCP